MSSVARLSFIVALLAVSVQAQAGLIAGDSFDYANFTELTTVSGGSGWQAGSAWAYGDSGKPGCAASVVAGLAFSTLSTAGNAVELKNSNNPADWEYATLSRNFGSGATAGETLWVSLLFRRNDNAASVDSTETGSYVTSGGNRELQMRGKGYVWSSGVDRAVLQRGGGSSGSAMTGAMNVGQTYMLIAEFPHIGQDATWPVSKMWILSESDFAALSGSAITEASLDAQVAAGYKVTQDPIWGSNQSLNAGDTAWLYGTYSALTGGGAYATMDELRYGTGNDATLAGVAPIVPEPATMSLLALGLLGLRKRR